MTCPLYLECEKYLPEHPTCNSYDNNKWKFCEVYRENNPSAEEEISDLRIMQILLAFFALVIIYLLFNIR